MERFGIRFISLLTITNMPERALATSDSVHQTPCDIFPRRISHTPTNRHIGQIKRFVDFLAREEKMKEKQWSCSSTTTIMSRQWGTDVPQHRERGMERLALRLQFNQQLGMGIVGESETSLSEFA